MSALMIEPTSYVRLDLGCGQSPREGFEGVDIAACAGVKHVVNLWKFPWPWEDSSVDEIHCSHHVEHIPMVYVSKTGNVYKGVPDSCDDTDLFMRFFDECHRILKPGGRMTVIVPCARNNRAFQDPTHRRFIVAESFHYLSGLWRRTFSLDHYGVKCDFAVEVGAITDCSEELRCDEVKQQRVNNLWNVVSDWRASLTAIKEGAPGLRNALTPSVPLIVKVSGDNP